MQKADKNRDPRHINRCQLPWMAKKKESNFPAERFITRLAEGTDRRRRGLAGGSRGAAGRAHTSPHLAAPASPWAGIAAPEAVPAHTAGSGPSIPAPGPLEGQSLQDPPERARHRAASLPASPGSRERAAAAVPGAQGPVAPGGQQHPTWGVWMAAPQERGGRGEDARHLG